MKKIIFFIFFNLFSFNIANSNEINFFCLVDTWGIKKNKDFFSYFKGEEIHLKLDLINKKIIDNTNNKELTIIHGLEGETKYKVKKNYDNYGQNDWSMFQFKTKVKYADGIEYKYTIGLKLSMDDKSPISLHSQSKRISGGITDFTPGKLLSYGLFVKLPCRKKPFSAEEKQRAANEDLCCYEFRKSLPFF